MNIIKGLGFLFVHEESKMSVFVFRQFHHQLLSVTRREPMINL